jgi:hypothetical protein
VNLRRQNPRPIFCAPNERRAARWRLWLSASFS